MEQEIRIISTELRVMQEPEKPPVISGYAAVFNQLSEIIWNFREEILPGAFSKALGRDDVRGLFNHDPNFVLGRSTAGTLKLWEDERGLGFELFPDPESQTIRDLVLLPMKRGDINQMSFGFTVDDENWIKPGDDTRTDILIRQIRDVHLFDISPVTYPAYPQTTANVRSLVQEMAAAGAADLTKLAADAQARHQLHHKRLEVAEKS